MSRGINVVVLAGNVGDCSESQSTKGDPAWTFSLAVEDRGGFATWVRVNAYSGLVQICRGRMEKGQFVIVRGELINRSGGLVEVRAEEVIWG
jgi:single-stranded DNA-binding protein